VNASVGVHDKLSHQPGELKSEAASMAIAICWLASSKAVTLFGSFLYSPSAFAGELLRGFGLLFL